MLNQSCKCRRLIPPTAPLVPLMGALSPALRLALPGRQTVLCLCLTQTDIWFVELNRFGVLFCEILIQSSGTC
jgi:hypothetical protein